MLVWSVMHNDMNLLHVTPTFYPATYWGGPIFSTYGLCNSLAAIPSVKLKVLTTDSAGPALSQRVKLDSNPAIYPNGYEVCFAQRDWGTAVSLEQLTLLPQLIRWADVVHLTGVYSFPTFPTLIACRLYNKPLVWSPRGALQASHEWSLAPRQTLKWGWEKLCNAVIGRRENFTFHLTAEEEKLATLARLPNHKTTVIPNGVNVPLNLPKRQRQPGGRLRLLFLGRIDPKKGLDNLLLAICLLSDPMISLEICGTGNKTYLAKMEKLSEELGLRNRVTFSGYVQGERKEKAFDDADVCVVPSHNENFCMVVVEALAHGVPAIASTGTPWAELEDKGCGLWVDNTPQNLAAAIRRVQGMNLTEMGCRGREWMERDFTWEAVARHMFGVYSDLCDGAT